MIRYQRLESVTSHSTKCRRRALISIVAAIAAVATLPGCSASYEAWAVTYEVSVADTASTSLTGVAYVEAQGRNGPSETIKLGDATGKGSPASWSKEATVTATKLSSVTATPAPDGVATCRILLDGKREIDSQTAAPGEPVICSVSTPPFD